LTVTIVLFVVCWAAMVCCARSSHPWLAAPLVLPTACFVVRLFAIQHDCGHGSFFSTARANDWVGRVLGTLTLTPYDYWRRSHAIHHATSGNLDARGIGDVDTLTVREYRARSAWGRLRYRVYRHPLILFGRGPAYVFVVQYRLPLGATRRLEPWVSTMGTNAVILAVIVGLVWALGLGVFLLVQVPVTLVAASIGVWLFYVQHQFEQTHWDGKDDWNLHEAAFHGSSYYELPTILRWITANLGVHHVHHLVSRIPSYRLNDVLRDHPELRRVGRLTIRQSLACTRLVLWDEKSRRLLSFADARRIG
jgi:omega-6 fatty acid desaturase (delta-12 desaturase)